MTTAEILKELQESMRTLLSQNQEMSQKIEKLETENQVMKRKSEDTDLRIKGNLEKLEKLNADAQELIEEMLATRNALEIDGYKRFEEVEWFFMEENFGKLSRDKVTVDVKAEVKTEPEEVVHERGEGPSREERVDEFFGWEGDHSAKSLRRFLEHYKVVRNINKAAGISGWNRSDYRANKLRLALRDAAADFVNFESSMEKEWTKDDNMLIEKLKDRYMNVQVIELNILSFEQSKQEGGEEIKDFMTKLQRRVVDAYDGDSQKELDRKVAWKFVIGVRDEVVRKRLIDEGWMKDRREAKPLEELLKIAETSKRKEDAVKAMSSSTGKVSMIEEFDNISAIRSKKSSNESSNSSKSNQSSSSSGMALEFIQCWYCKKEHRGGWFYCSKRRKEAPKWRPANRANSKFGTGSGRGNPNDSSEAHRKDFQ